MPNPTISFRLSSYQLARGLRIIRNLQPDYQFTSIGQIVKMIYIDYLAKMSLGRADSIPQHLIDEIEGVLYKIKKAPKTLKEFTKETESTTKDEKSIITSVDDFSPPTDLLEEDNNENIKKS